MKVVKPQMTKNCMKILYCSKAPFKLNIFFNNFINKKNNGTRVSYKHSTEVCKSMKTSYFREWSRIFAGRYLICINSSQILINNMYTRCKAHFY